MDLEKRTRDYFAALDSLEGKTVAAFFAADARYLVPGVLDLVGREAIEALLATVRRNMDAMKVARVEFQVRELAVAGRTSFAQWDCVSHRATGPVVFRGVHVLRWNETGEIADATIHTDPDAVRRMAVGLAASQPAQGAPLEGGAVQGPA